jgi:hypothetical protein
MTLRVCAISPGKLALRIQLLRDTAAYLGYVAAQDSAEDVIAELAEEVSALDPTIRLARLVVTHGDELVDSLTRRPEEIVLLDVTALASDDWSTVDRRRSDLAHRGVVVFVVTDVGFEALMRHAPNFASWLAGEVFAVVHEDEDATELGAQRLAELRVWGRCSDDEIVAKAAAGSLPPDPEYAEWLILLGRADLLPPATR